MRPKAGDPAPDFSCHATDGSTIKLADFRGKKLVLYFYPMDDTPGCTAQACSLRDVNRDIAAKGAAILGVSSQDEASHKKFTAKYKLNFPLLADTDRTMAKAYGVAGSGLFGVARALTGMNERVTFIIDETGHIVRVIDDPNCADHGEEVLSTL
mgnify:CR=1 FL=1